MEAEREKNFVWNVWIAGTVAEMLCVIVGKYLMENYFSGIFMYAMNLWKCWY